MSPPPKWPESLEEAKALSRAEWKELIRPQITISNCFAAFLLLVIIVSGAIFFMVLVKWIQPSGIWPDTVDNWYEICSQILNACFTITALWTQPIRAILAYWTWKWYGSTAEEKQKYATLINKTMPDIYLFPVKPISTVPIIDSNLVKPNTVSPPPADSVETVSSNNITQTSEIPRGGDNDIEVIILNEERNSPSSLNSTTQSLNSATPTWKWYTILALLNGQCIFQYPITAVMWIYIGKAHERPDWVLGVFLPMSFLCGMISGIWPLLMTLDRKKRIA